VKPQILRARIVLPICRPPISDGAVIVSGERIVAVDRWQKLSRDFSGDVVDLGETVLLPGLVNAHCHLDYTSMAGQFPSPKLFTDWLKLITTSKADFSYSEYAESWLNGAKMLVRTGTTTVGDIETVPELLPEVLGATPLRIVSFLEMTGIRSRRQPKIILREASERIEGLLPLGFTGGLSPHAPYSTLPELLRLSAELARRKKWLMSIHVAESSQEFEMFMRGRGEMFDWLRRNERDMSDCGQGSPVQHLARCGALGKNLLAIHVNYVAKNDAALLARRKVTVVHCPRSHSFFRHDTFPYQRFFRAGITICLGTDSLASVYQRRRQPVELSLFEEMRTFAANQPSTQPRRILDMVTVNPAGALGLKGQVGQLSKRAFADLVALPFSGKSSDVYEAVLHHEGAVSGSMIKGQWAIAPA
jgi:cytosine/adenosine deaminase-related metal-dependent hydrolase